MITEKFSPVIKHTTVRVVLALAVHFGWIQQGVANAFQHGLLQEGINMVQPRVFVDAYFPNHISKLHKSLYGLKQAP